MWGGVHGVSMFCVGGVSCVDIWDKYRVGGGMSVGEDGGESPCEQASIGTVLIATGGLVFMQGMGGPGGRKWGLPAPFILDKSPIDSCSFSTWSEISKQSPSLIP